MRVRLSFGGRCSQVAVVVSSVLHCRSVSTNMSGKQVDCDVSRKNQPVRIENVFLAVVASPITSLIAM